MFKEEEKEDIDIDERYENKEFIHNNSDIEEISQNLNFEDSSEEFLEACNRVMEGSVQEKIWAYTYFIDNNIKPNIESLYEIALEDLSSYDFLLVAQSFIFLAKFYKQQEFEIVSKLLHSPRDDDDYLISLIRVLTKSFDVFFNNVRDLLDVNNHNLLRLIAGRIPKLCRDTPNTVDYAANLLSRIFDFYNQFQLTNNNQEEINLINSYQQQIIREFIQYTDLELFMDYYVNVEQSESVSNLLKIVCLSQPTLINIDSMIDWIGSIFEESNPSCKRDFSIILSFFSSDEEKSLHIISIFSDFILSSINEGILYNRINAAIIYSHIAKFSKNEDIAAFLSEICFGDFILEGKDSIDNDLLRIFLEGLQYLFLNKEIPKFDDLEEAQNELFDLTEELETSKEQTIPDFYLSKLISFKHIPISEIVLDILSFIDSDIE